MLLTTRKKAFLSLLSASLCGFAAAFAPQRAFVRQGRADVSLFSKAGPGSSVEGDTPLGAIRSVSEFRDALDKGKTLTSSDRLKLIQQASILIGDLYTHLPLKRAMHSIDPLQRLRLLKSHVDDYTVTEFHAELLDIFKDLRDLHTNYILPAPFGSQLAFLGIFVQRYFEDGEKKYLVSRIFPNLVADEDLVPGVEITHWNGMPMELAIARNADKEAGSNIPARLARGLENLTFRSMRSSFPPDEDWVTLTFLVDGEPREARLDWKVFDSAAEITQPKNDKPTGLVKGLNTPLRFNIGMDERAEIFRRARKLLFDPEGVEEEARVKKFKGKVPDQTEGMAQANIIPTARPDELSAKIVETESGKFGYLKISTFFMRDFAINEFLNEILRLLILELPNDGLILDVRGNGGGFVIASEFLHQFFTPKHITPEPSQFIATQGALDLARAEPSMAPWVPSLEQAVSTGSTHSAGVPLSPEDIINSFGQVYFGPVVLITDAYCYSACDIFAAAFKDHEMGTIIGVDDNVGAGGANVLQHSDLVTQWKGGPLETLPGGAVMRISLRRTLRVGKLAGQVLEDVGVKPDVRHYPTRRDLVEGDVDLFNKAGEILAQGKPRRLDVEFTKVGFFGWRQLGVKLTTQGIDSIDIYANDRPATEAVDIVEDGITEKEIKIDKPKDNDVLRIEGWDDGELVAKRILVGPFQVTEPEPEKETPENQ